MVALFWSSSFSGNQHDTVNQTHAQWTNKGGLRSVITKLWKLRWIEDDALSGEGE